MESEQPSNRLQITLPPGWIERPNPGGPREFWATSDGSTGLLQVSRLPADDFPFIAGQADLGAFAAELGARLTAPGQSWGRAAGSRQGTCAFGRFGFAMFVGGEYPAMLLWLTVSASSALMWTWLGPSPAAEEVNQALRIVLETRDRAE